MNHPLWNADKKFCQQTQFSITSRDIIYIPDQICKQYIIDSPRAASEPIQNVIWLHTSKFMRCTIYSVILKARRGLLPAFPSSLFWSFFFLSFSAFCLQETEIALLWKSHRGFSAKYNDIRTDVVRIWSTNRYQSFMSHYLCAGHKSS